MRTQALMEGLGMTILGIVILLFIPSQVQEIPGMATETSPSFFPMVAAVALILSGIVMILQTVFNVSPPTSLNLSRHEVLRVCLATLLLLGYTYLFPYLGFVVTSAGFFGVFAYLFGARSLWKIALNMIMIPVVVWLFFEQLFRIPLPHGVLF